MRHTLSYADAVEMHERSERLYLAQRNVMALELALIGITKGGIVGDDDDDEEYRRIFMELEMAKSNMVVAASHVGRLL